MSIMPDTAPTHEQELCPCERYDWCSGHRPIENVEDLSFHLGVIARLAGSFSEVVVRFNVMEPTRAFPNPQPPTFSIDAWSGDWEIAPTSVDAEVEEYVSLLAEAREEMKRFIASHPGLAGETSVPQRLLESDS